jgi:hypothetical protein
MSGTNQSVKITLRNPVLKDDLLTYEINVFDNTIARDWYLALKQILSNGNLLEKNYCFLGFPDTVRNLDYLCTQLNISIGIINLIGLCVYYFTSNVFKEYSNKLIVILVQRIMPNKFNTIGE